MTKKVKSNLYLGIFGWISLNYLLGRLEYPTKTFGMLDLGGASLQIAFEPVVNDDSKRFTLKTIKLLTKHGKVLTYEIFVKTFLGYGTTEIRKKYISRILESEDPCLLNGSSVRLAEKEIRGLGNFEQCLKDTNILLEKEISLTPEIDHAKQQFYGVSEFWYSTDDLFHLQGNYDYSSFYNLSQRYCSFKFEAVKSQLDSKKLSHKLDEDRIKHQCFKSAYIINLLHHGFGFPVSGESFKSVHNSGNQPVTWTIGALLFEISGLHE